jgi:hypothetical protein
MFLDRANRIFLERIYACLIELSTMSNAVVKCRILREGVNEFRLKLYEFQRMETSAGSGKDYSLEIFRVLPVMKCMMMPRTVETKKQDQPIHSPNSAANRKPPIETL